MTEETMYGMLVSHDVGDYDKFKASFDAHEGVRRAAGCAMHTVHREDGNENRVVVYLGSPNLQALQELAGSDELKAAMQEATVQGRPEISFVQNRGMNLDPNPAATAGVIADHSVSDYGTWRGAFDAHDGARKAAGAIGHSINTGVEDENRVIAYLQSDDIGKLRSFAQSDELKGAMANAGVTGPPKMTFLNRVEMKRYE